MKRGTPARIGVVILIVVLMCLVFDLGSRWRSQQLRNWGLAGLAVLQAVVSAWFLAHIELPKRSFVPPTILLIAGAGSAVGLAWMGRVDGGLPLLPFLSMTIVNALIGGAVPAFVLGCVFRRFRDVPGRGRVFLRSARALFATSVFLGMLALALPLVHLFHQSELDRAKAYVEAVAVEVDRTPRSTGQPVPEIGEILRRMGDRPRVLVLSWGGLTCEEQEGALVLEFIERYGMSKPVLWTYRVPSGPWKRRKL